MGAGVSGQLALKPLHPPPGSTAADQEAVQSLAIAPGVAPWVAGRMGIVGSNEAGLTYSGRAIRLDVRHAFNLSKNTALSLGLGGSALFAQRPGGDQPGGVYGAGGDVPLLVGWHSTGGLYSFWFGPRGGFDVLLGRVVSPDVVATTPTPPLFDVSGKHFYGGLTLGGRVGFRHVHLALELNASYHAADGSFSPSPPAAGQAPPGMAISSSVQQISVTPAGALEVTF